MKKYIFTTVLSLALVATPVFASVYTGTISTGVSTTGSDLEGLVIVEPTADPVAGSYTSTQSVTLTGGDGTQSIHYIIDGVAPTCTTGTVYSAPITVDVSKTISAISCYANGVASSVVNFAYVISLNPPTGGSGGGGGGITPPPTYDADFDDDGKVDIFDLNIMTTNWGSTSATNTTGDANGDGNVDLFDLNILSTTWTG